LHSSSPGMASRFALAHELRVPANVDCTMGVPEVTKPIRSRWPAWPVFLPCAGQQLQRAREQAQPASIASSRGASYGPAFPDPRRRLVIKEKYFSDPLRAVRGHLIDRNLTRTVFRDAMVGFAALLPADVEAHALTSRAIGPLTRQLDGHSGDERPRAGTSGYQKSTGLKSMLAVGEAGVLRSNRRGRAENNVDGGLAG